MSFNKWGLGNKLLKDPVELCRSVIRGEGGLGEVRLRALGCLAHSASVAAAVGPVSLKPFWQHSGAPQAGDPHLLAPGSDSIALPCPQNNASKLLLAIMESRHDSENAERILYNMRPKELVSPGIPPQLLTAHLHRRQRSDNPLWPQSCPVSPSKVLGLVHE